MQTKVKYSVFPHIKGFFKDKTLRNRDNSCYLHSAIIGENTFQEEWTLP